MALPEKKQQKFTFADYLTWSNEKRWEIVDGIPLEMSAPSTSHQRIVRNLSKVLIDVLEKNKSRCELFFAPFDVILDGDVIEDSNKSENVVQPDISIICDQSKIKESGCFGAPDLIIEIVSPSSVIKDFNTKFDKYELFGVKEYWIISPVEKEISVYKLVDGKYRKHNVYKKEDKILFGKENIFEIELLGIFD